jgi:hypothetical protein
MCCRAEQATLTTERGGVGPKTLASFGKGLPYPMRRCTCGKRIPFHWLAEHRAACEPYLAEAARR